MLSEYRVSWFAKPAASKAVELPACSHVAVLYSRLPKLNSERVMKASDGLHRLTDRALVRHERASKANEKLHRLKTTCSWPASNG